MRKIRSCVENTLATGRSGCQLDFANIRALIIVQHGQVVNFDSISSPSNFASLIHANAPARIYPINGIVEYAKSGGEPQVSALGYDGNGVTGLSPRTDTFTLSKVSEQIAASLTKNMNKRFDVYYVDENGVVYGIRKEGGVDGGVLYGFPMLTIYPTVTPHPTSSAQATMTISCCLENAREAIEKFDYVELGFNPIDALNGLVPVDLVEIETGKYKVVETIGGYDRTEEFGVVDGIALLFDGVSAATYAEGLITLTAVSGKTPSLKRPSALFAGGVRGIEYNATITSDRT